MAALSMEASEKVVVGEEGKPPEEWMADDVSSSERLNHVWICLVCWWVIENANSNLIAIWGSSWVLNQQATGCVSMVGIGLKSRQTENVEGVEAAPILEVVWVKLAMLAWHRFEVESWKKQIFSS